MAKYHIILADGNSRTVTATAIALDDGALVVMDRTEASVVIPQAKLPSPEFVVKDIYAAGSWQSVETVR